MQIGKKKSRGMVLSALKRERETDRIGMDSLSALYWSLLYFLHGSSNSQMLFQAAGIVMSVNETMDIFNWEKK